MKNIFTIFIALIASCTISSGQSLPNYVPTNGLVGWWPFNGNANDESGNGNNGTVYGPSLTSDRFGNFNTAYNFNLNYIEVNNNPAFNLTNSLSINTWYKIGSEANNSSLNMAMVSRHINGSTESSFTVYNENICGPTVYITDANSQISFIRNQDFCDTTNWHMITMSLSNNSLKMYLDGVLYSSNDITADIKQTSLPLVFGGYNNPIVVEDIIGRMIGKIDDIGI
jgi:hypothetical protein